MDGQHDDTSALNAILRGERVRTAKGRLAGCKSATGIIRVPTGDYYVSGPVCFPYDRQYRMDAMVMGLNGYIPEFIS